MYLLNARDDGEMTQSVIAMILVYARITQDNIGIFLPICMQGHI